MARKKGQYRAGEGTGPEVAAALTQDAKGDTEAPGKEIVKRRHLDFSENELHWRWLLDSYEGGPRYRNATYGPDRKGWPVRNLIRHRGEYPDPKQFPASNQNWGVTQVGMDQALVGVDVGQYPGMLGADPAATALDDDYEFRRARTQPPEFVRETVEIHLSKIYKQEVTRKASANLTEWWKDVDGRGTVMDDWMRETVAPLILVLGCLDVCLDHPRAPAGRKITNRAEEKAAGLDRCVASYILPENMVWWEEDDAYRYVECLVREYVHPSKRRDFDAKGRKIDPDSKGPDGIKWCRDYVRLRHWTATESTLYNYEGDEILEQIPNPYGRIPIIRIAPHRKHRSPMIGTPFYEYIAGQQREAYNRESELVVSDTIQSAPLLSGPEDYCKGDNTVKVGANKILPKKKNPETGTYEGWEYTSPPKDPAESLRQNLANIRDQVDRRAALTKPAGAAEGRLGGSVGQSGISKQLDAVQGNDVLSNIAKILAKAEKFIAEYATMVLDNEPPERAELDEIKVGYPTTFELFSADEILAAAVQFQMVLSQAGNSPAIEFAILSATVRKMIPGLEDLAYEEMDKEIKEFLATKATIKAQEQEFRVASMQDASDALAGDGSKSEGAEESQGGQSAGTQVSGQIMGAR